MESSQLFINEGWTGWDALLFIDHSGGETVLMTEERRRADRFCRLCRSGTACCNRSQGIMGKLPDLQV